MKVLLLDHYDSFTHNLANQIKRTTGAELVIKRSRDRSILTQTFDVLILSPGPMTPATAGLSRKVAQKTHKPILGVCLGMQILHHFYGASVTKSKHPLHGERIALQRTSSKLFKHIQNGTLVMRYNSLQCRPQNTGYAFTSYCPKGEIMSMEKGNRVGMQFHPESFLTQKGDLMMRNFFKYYC